MICFARDILYQAFPDLLESDTLLIGLIVVLITVWYRDI